MRTSETVNRGEMVGYWLHDRELLRGGGKNRKFPCLPRGSGVREVPNKRGFSNGGGVNVRKLGQSDRAGKTGEDWTVRWRLA